MKANEAPYKIYVHVRANKELGTTWHGKKITNSDIEYTRTDAFIEKARKWFEEQNEWFDLDGNRQCDMESFDNFVNYMEGE